MPINPDVTLEWVLSKNNGLLNRVFSSLSDGEYLIKKSSLSKSNNEGLLLGGERGTLEVNSFESLSSERFYSAFVGASHEDVQEKRVLFIGIPILGYDGTDRLDSVLFLV